MANEHDKAPAFQWYPKDYLTDPVVVAMSLEAEGAYRRLMDYCWLDGSLPDDFAAMAAMAKARSVPHFSKLWSQFVVKFAKNEQGRWIHPRLERERTKQAESRERRQKAAEERWARERALQEQGTCNADAMQCLPSSSSTPSSTPVNRHTERAKWGPSLAQGPHPGHVHCSVACVPQFLHDEFLRALNRPLEQHEEADEELRAGYLLHVAQWPQGQAVGDVLKFWRAWFHSKYGADVSKATSKRAKHQASVDAALDAIRSAGKATA